MHPGIIRPIHILGALLFLIFASFNPADSTRSFKKIKVDGGFISGTVNKDKDIHIFKGIPFAAPPLGELRWKAPQPVIPWTGTRACTAFGASPMQASPVPFSMWTSEFLIPKEPISEDCLTLNIWTGAKSDNEQRPVLVWIYGGGFASGGSACPIYDGEAMAKKGIIFVSINYRVGIFGFFAHPELTKESPAHASGNYGLLDQIAALQWVQRNIASFGGDPEEVTIAGQSAGSMSVNCLVASPLAKGLFNKAIGESGASFTRGNASLKGAEAEGTRIMNSLNVSSIHDLRKIPDSMLMKKLAINFLEKGKLTTSRAKAKALISYLEKLLTKSKEESEANKNILLKRFGNRPIVYRLFKEIGPVLKVKNSGFLKLTNLGQRISDGSEQAKVEWTVPVVIEKPKNYDKLNKTNKTS